MSPYNRTLQRHLMNYRVNYYFSLLSFVTRCFIFFFLTSAEFSVLTHKYANNRVNPILQKRINAILIRSSLLNSCKCWSSPKYSDLKGKIFTRNFIWTTLKYNLHKTPKVTTIGHRSPKLCVDHTFKKNWEPLLLQVSSVKSVCYWILCVIHNTSHGCLVRSYVREHNRT